jgi:hypothetical protein
MRRLLFASIAFGLLLLPTFGGSAAAAAPPSCPPAQHRAAGIWRAAATTSPWQWQLQGRADLSVPACFFDLDGFETPAATVAALHRSGRVAIC